MCILKIPNPTREPRHIIRKASVKTCEGENYPSEQNAFRCLINDCESFDDQFDHEFCDGLKFSRFLIDVPLKQFLKISASSTSLFY